MTFCCPPGPAGSGTTSQAKESSSTEARLICVMVMAASPAKKSAVVPGPGMAASVKIASWIHVMASTIAGSVNVHCVPSSLHGAAPQPSQTVARFSHTLKSKSRTTRPCLPDAGRCRGDMSRAASYVHSRRTDQVGGVGLARRCELVVVDEDRERAVGERVGVEPVVLLPQLERRRQQVVVLVALGALAASGRCRRARRSRRTPARSSRGSRPGPGRCRRRAAWSARWCSRRTGCVSNVTLETSSGFAST